MKLKTKVLLLLFLITIGVLLALPNSASAYSTYGIFRYTTSSDETGEYVIITGLTNKNVANIEIPETINDYPVKEIANSAFCDASCVTVELPETITSIGKSVFKNTNIAKIKIPSGVTELKEYTFGYCKFLKEIEMPNITTLNTSVFINCTSLESINISNVISIPEYTFSGCVNLKSININNAETINKGAFRRCTSINNINLPKVNLIKESAFEGCTSLESINIQTDQNTIEGNAFKDCTGLKNIEFSNVKEFKYAQISGRKYYPFSGCTGINTVRISNFNSTISFSNLFEDSINIKNITLEKCTNYISEEDVIYELSSGAKYILVFYAPKKENTTYTIPSGIKKIDTVFNNCQYLQTIEIPSTIISINEDWIKNCENLNNINVNENNSNFASVNGVLFSKDKKELKSFPCGKDTSYSIQSGVTKINNYAFQYCTKLENIVIPNTVTYIGSYAFRNCINLEEINSPNSIRTIGRSAFEACNKIENLEIPNGVTGIGAEVIKDCNNLRNLKIPGSLKEIYAYTFADAINLQNVEIGNGVEQIDDYAFNNSNNIVQINIPSSITVIQDAFEACTKIESVEIPTSVDLQGFFSDKTTMIVEQGSKQETKAINKKKPYRYKTDEVIDISNTYTIDDIPDLERANDWYDYDSGIIYGVGKVAYEPEVTVRSGETVLTKGTDYAVEYVNNLYYGTATIIVTGVGRYTGTIEKNVNIVPDYLNYEINNNEVTITGIKGNPFQYTGSLYIPEAINGYKVTKIGDEAFKNNTELEEIVLYDENSIKYIGNSAFSGCTNLRRFVEYGFGYVESLINIGDLAFENCEKLTAIKIGKNTTSIGINAFKGCIRLAYINVDKNNENYLDNNGILFNKEKTELIWYPTEKKDTSYSIPDTVKTIKSRAFENNIYLTSVVVPYDVTNIAEDAFEGCTNLKLIVVKGSYAEQYAKNNNIEYEYNQNVNVITECTIEPIEDQIYSGEEIRPLVVVKNGETILTEGVDYIVQYSENINPGIALICVIGQGSYISNKDVNFNILRATYDMSDVKFEDKTVDYDGNAHSIEITGNLPDGVNVEYINNGKIEAGMYTITAKFTGDVTNYNAIEDKTAVLTINKATYDMSDVKFEDKTVDYDGNAHSIEITGNLPDGVNVEYINNGKIEAGTYTITAKFTGDATNYNAIEDKEAILTIIKKVHTHTWNNGTITKQATCIEEGIKTYTCTECSETKTEKIAKIAHTYKKVTTKATLSKDGKIEEKCSVCGDVKSTTKIAYPKIIKLKTTSYTYDGKAKKPAVVVTDSNGKTIASSNYDVKYSNNKKVGTAKVTVTFKGNYEGKKELTFTINPNGTSLKNLTAGKKQFKATWNKQATETTGYEIQYSTNKNFKSSKTSKIKKNKTTSSTIKSLKAKKKYYVRIRTYKVVNGKTYYSGWSKTKNVTTKK